MANEVTLDFRFRFVAEILKLTTTGQGKEPARATRSSLRRNNGGQFTRWMAVCSPAMSIAESAVSGSGC